MDCRFIGLFDIYRGCVNHWLWFKPAIDEIKKKYSRSIIGPLWQTIAILLLVLCIGPLYSLLYSVNQQLYIPYISIGFVLWIFIVSYINEVCYSFISSEAEIKNLKIFYSCYIYRCLVKNIFIFFHSCIALFIILPFYINIKEIMIFEVLLGLILIIIFLFFLGIILALLSTRYRDFSQITSTSMQFFFFVTPILWIPNNSKLSFNFLKFNPFNIFIEIIRNPLLGINDNYSSIFIALIYVTILILLSMWIFTKKYYRLIFWL
jgi:hypothetical protein